MPPVGFEPTISAGERPQTHALDRAATGIGVPQLCCVLFIVFGGIPVATHSAVGVAALLVAEWGTRGNR